MKCLRRKQKALHQQLGQPLEFAFKKVVRPFQYLQMDMTGKHVAKGGREVYGLVVMCLQTYNSRILGVEDRKVETISLALEVLVQEVGVPDFIA